MTAGVKGLEDESSVYTPDEVLERLGKKRGILQTIIIGSLPMLCYATANLSSAFIAKECGNCTDAPLSIIDEFNLQNSLWTDATSTSFMIGNMIGGVFVSHAADKYGRRPVTFFTYPFMAICGFLSSFSPNMYVFTFLRFLQGIFYTSSALSLWVLCYETSPVSLRFFTNVIFGITWVAGYCLVGPLAYISSSWRTLVTISALINIPVYILCFIYIKESLHFLISNNRMDEAAKWLKYMKSDITANQLVKPEVIEEKRGLPLFLEIWKHKKLLFHTIILIYIWVGDTFIYFGLSLFSTSLAGNIYVNYILLGLVELPASICAPFLMEKIGRKKALMAEHIVVAVAFAVLLFVPETSVLRLILWMIGKFAVSCSFLTIFAVGSEIFPTNIRNVSIGLCETMSRIGGILAPRLALLNSISEILPSIVILIISLAGAVSIMALPETHKKPLPSTIKETDA